MVRNHDSRAIRKVDLAASSMSSTIIFDGDDTLWRTMPLYTASKRRFFALMTNLGFDTKSVENDFEARDIKNVSAWGFTVERFRRSMVETYEAFSRKQGKGSTFRIEQRISQIATSVVRNKTGPMPRAREVLRVLHGRYRLVLLTKGEYALQERRVTENGLSEFFERVVIVEHKNRETFLRVVTELEAAPGRTWSVGDSLRSDIVPALDAGLNAVWIPQETWGYESEEMTGKHRVLHVRTIRELPQLLKKEGGAIR